MGRAECTHGASAYGLILQDRVRRNVDQTLNCMS